MMKIGDDFGLFVGSCVGAAVPRVKRGYPKDLQTFGVFFGRRFKRSAVSGGLLRLLAN